MTWYTQSEWAKVKAAATDPERFESTYPEWVEMAQKALVDLRAVGIVASKVFINSNELLAWCLTHNKQNNAAARAAFVAESPGRKDEGDAS